MTIAYRKIEFAKIDRPEIVDPGPAAILQWLEIDMLVIDDSYQRELKIQNWKAIRKIAAGFRWSKFSPVFVAPVEGGLYAIIDGQHRTHAAAICGFSQVPCQIVHMSQTEQAAAFASVNGTVTQVTAHQVLKAALAARESWAVNAAEIASAGGGKLMAYNRSAIAKQPGEIYGTKGFLDVIAQRPREAIIAALNVLMGADGYRDNRDIWENWCLTPLLLALAERPAVLQRPDFCRALEDFDFWQLIEDDTKERAEARRLSRNHPPKAETLRAGILDWIDKTFPARVALPAPSKADIMGRIGEFKVG